MIEVMADMSDSIVRENARREAKKAVEHDLSELINPSDVRGADDDVTEWSDIDRDTLEMEIGESVSVMRSERQSPYDGITHNTAIILCRNDLTRAPMDDLTFDSKAKAIENGYWPNSMNRVEVTEQLSNNHKPDWFHHCKEDAWDEVTAGIAEGLDPRETDD